jgi:hypothetical protein
MEEREVMFHQALLQQLLTKSHSQVSGANPWQQKPPERVKALGVAFYLEPTGDYVRAQYDS